MISLPCPRRRSGFRALWTLLALTIVGTWPVGAARAQARPAQGTPAPAAAGQPPVGRRVDAKTADATRAELTQALDAARRRAADPALRAPERDRARQEAETIARRLSEGDFRVGDRFLAVITVDTVRREEIVVREGQVVELPALPLLSVAGVLESELPNTLLQHLKRYYRNPEVRVEPIVRISLSGAVAKPGPYSVLPDTPLIDMLAAAGGMAQQASLENVTVERGGRRIIDGKTFQRSVREGKTVAEAGIQSGDDVEVVVKQRRDYLRYAQFGLIALSTFVAILSLIRNTANY